MLASEAEGSPRTAPLLVTSEAFEALEPEWAKLHATAPGATPFTHPRWHATWLRHFGANTDPVFLSFRDGEELVGVVALDMGRGVVRELGDHNVRDYCGPLVANGFEGGVASALLEWLREDMTGRLELWGIAAGAPFRQALLGAAEASGWSVHEEREAVAPVLDLPADWDAYVASLSKHDRHELRRKLRNLEVAGAVTYRVVGADTPGEVDVLLALMRASHTDKAAFLTPSMEAFFRDLCAELGVLGLARIGSLRLDGRVAAMLLTFETAEATYLYNSGYDPQFSHFAVGLLSKAIAIREAMAAGKRHFDFLRGEEDYKHRLGGAPRDIYRYLVEAKPGTIV